MKSTLQSRLVHGSTRSAFPGRTPEKSDLLSPRFYDDVSRRQNVYCRILIPIVMGLALWAIPFSYGQRQTLGDEPADMATLAGWEEAVNDLQFFTIPKALVFCHTPERGHSYIADGASQAMIGNHSPDVKVFNGEYIEATNERSRHLVEIILATVGDMRLQSGYLDALTIPSTASFVPTGKNTLQPSQLGRIVAEMFRVGYALPRGQRCQPAYSEVYTHNFPSLGKGVHFLVEAKCYEVAPRTIFGYRDCAGATCKRPRPVNIQSANAGEVQVPIHGVPLEPTPSVFSGLTAALFLEGRICTSLLEKILERCLKMSKGLLLGYAGCFSQPREVFGLAMLCPFGRAGVIVDGLAATKGIGTETKRPVVGMADATEDAGKFSFLRRARIETLFISHVHKNRLTYVMDNVNIYFNKIRRAKARGFNPKELG